MCGGTYFYSQLLGWQKQGGSWVLGQSSPGIGGEILYQKQSMHRRARGVSQEVEYLSSMLVTKGHPSPPRNTARLSGFPLTMVVSHACICSICVSNEKWKHISWRWKRQERNNKRIVEATWSMSIYVYPETVHHTLKKPSETSPRQSGKDMVREENRSHLIWRPSFLVSWDKMAWQRSPAWTRTVNSLRIVSSL